VDYLAELRKELTARIEAREARLADLKTFLDVPAKEGRTALTAEETTKLAELRSAVEVYDLEDPKADGYDKSIHAVRAQLDPLEAIEKRQHEAATSTANKGGGVVRNEARTYRPDVDHGFLGDVYRRGAGLDYDGSAAARLQRHTHEFEVEKRAIATAAMAGAVPPQYLVDQFAELARAGRPFLNSLNNMPLPPDGISFVIPRGTTGATGAATTEGAAFTDGNPANTDLPMTVNLMTSAVDISRTLLMRGGPIVDQILFPDMIGSVAVAGNVSALNGNGTAPQHRGVLQVPGISAVTYTDGTPTVQESWPKFADAIQRINSLRFMPGNVIYMTPRRWGWITSAVDSNGRPLFEFSTTAPNSVIGLGKAAEYGQIVGTLQGLPVITDASIPTNLGAGTNEDIVIVARTADILYWEDEYMSFTLEQATSTAPGQVRLAVGQFQLFTAGRYPTSISTIGGTGFVAPTF
jgi:HK97 family phage major capsid protein